MHILMKMLVPVYGHTHAIVTDSEEFVEAAKKSAAKPSALKRTQGPLHERCLPVFMVKCDSRHTAEALCAGLREIFGVTWEVRESRFGPFLCSWVCAPAEDER